jgi:very-short-patch-repair endonuclease
MRDKPSTDHLIASIASRQHGVVSRRQLLDAGVGRGQVHRAAAAGRLHHLHTGVYAAGHRALTREGRWMAAVLACGPRAVLSHHSAAALWGLPVNDNGLTRITAPTVHQRRRIDAHRARLHARDRDVRHGIPVTSLARVLADISHALDDERFHRAVKEAQFRGLWVDAEIEDALERRDSRRLRDYLGDETLTQTELEDRFLRICRRYRIPTPVTQFGVKPRIDFIWPDRRLVVEVDGWEAHRTRVAFQDDRTTTNALQLQGFMVLRYTYADVTRRAGLVADQVRYAGNLSSTHSGPSSARRCQTAAARDDHRACPSTTSPSAARRSATAASRSTAGRAG